MEVYLLKLHFLPSSKKIQETQKIWDHWRSKKKTLVQFFNTKQWTRNKYLSILYKKTQDTQLKLQNVMYKSFKTSCRFCFYRMHQLVKDWFPGQEALQEMFPEWSIYYCLFSEWWSLPAWKSIIGSPGNTSSLFSKIQKGHVQRTTVTQMQYTMALPLSCYPEWLDYSCMPLAQVTGKNISNFVHF